MLICYFEILPLDPMMDMIAVVVVVFLPITVFCAWGVGFWGVLGLGVGIKGFGGLGFGGLGF